MRERKYNALIVLIGVAALLWLLSFAILAAIH